MAYALLLASCDNPFGPETDDVGTVLVQPPSASVAVGASTSLSASITDTQGQSLAGRRLFWSSQNPTIATVSQTGTVTGATPGTTTIAASSGGKSGLASVTVIARPVSVVRVTPNDAQITVGQTRTLTAEALDAGSRTVPGKTFIWASTNDAVASVSSTGVVTAVAPGNATISASVDGVSGSSTITSIAVPVAHVSVSPPSTSVTVGSSVQLLATPLAADSSALSGRTIQWSSSGNTIATVSSNGLVVGLAPGKVTITATVERKTGTSAITVSPVPIETITISPPSTTIPAGGTAQLTATAKDVGDNILGGRSFTWTSDQPAIATVSASGLVTGATQGLARITAAAEGKTGVSLVTVTPVAIASIDVTPPTASLSIGGTTQLTATPKDAQGTALPGRVITWLTGAPSVATVSQTGLVTAVGAGNALIFAASEGVSGSSNITVSSSALTLTPPATTINAGGATSLTATMHNSAGAPLVGQLVTFASSNVSVVSVSPTSGSTDTNGQVTTTATGVAIGAATITATSGTAQATSTIQVASVPVATVTVTPSPVSVAETQSTQLTATAKDANGNVLTGRTIVWSSSNPQVSVSSTGLVTAVASSGGQAATITATAPGAGTGGSSPSGTASVTVTFLPVASVSVAPSPATVTVNGTTQLTATLFASGGAQLSTSGRTVTWGPSANPSIATVNSTGRITGVALGSTTVPVAASSPGQGSPATTTVSVNVSNVPVASVTVTPGPTATVHVGSIYFRTFTAVTKDASGNVLTGRTIVWSTSDASKATVDPLSGVVTGVGTGSVTITATSEGVPGTSSVTVDLVTVSAVAVTPGTATLTPPQTQQLAATPQDSAGNTISGSALAGRTTSWSSSQPAFATVSSSGLVTAVGQAAGSSVITATVSGPNGNSGTSAITVLAPVANVTIASFNPDSVIAPNTVAGTVTVTDAASNPLSGRSVTFASSNTNLATVTPSGTTNASGQVAFTVTGVANAAAPANVNITATSGGVTSAPQAVRAMNPVNAVTLTAPSDSVIGTSGTINTSVTLKDAFNNTIGNQRVVSYSSGTPSVATVSAAGVVTFAGSLGTSVITATSEGKSGTKTVRALPPVASVSVAINPDSVEVSSTVTAVATLRDASNNVLTGRPVSWTSGTTTVATVDMSSGVVTGVSVGTSSITGTAEGQSGIFTEKVIAGIQTIALAPTPPTPITQDSLIGPGTISLTATAKDAGAAPIVGRQLAIASTNTSVATVSPTSGVTNASGEVAVTVTSVAPGNSTISASSGGKADNFVVRMLAPVATVAVTASGDSIIGTGTLQANAALTDAGGNPLTGRPTSWASSNPSIATVSASGLVAGVAAGNATITASAEGKSGSLIVRILPPVASVTVTAPHDSVIAGVITLQATAVLRDASNNVITGRPLTWTSGFAAASVSSSGLVSGVGTTGGTGGISASSEGVTSNSLAVRALPPVATVTVSAPDSSIDVGNTVQAVATTRDASSNVLTGRPITWQASTAPSIATVSAAGLVSALTPGQISVVALSEGKQGLIPVFRSLGPINTVTVNPPTLNVSVPNTSAPVTVTVTDGASIPNPLGGVSCSIVSSDQTKATVSAANATTDSNGQFTFTVTAVQSGSATMTVTCGTKTGTTAVTVP